MFSLSSSSPLPLLRAGRKRRGKQELRSDPGASPAPGRARSAPLLAGAVCEISQDFVFGGGFFWFFFKPLCFLPARFSLRYNICSWRAAPPPSHVGGHLCRGEGGWLHTEIGAQGAEAEALAGLLAVPQPGQPGGALAAAPAQRYEPALPPLRLQVPLPAPLPRLGPCPRPLPFRRVLPCPRCLPARDPRPIPPPPPHEPARLGSRSLVPGADFANSPPPFSGRFAWFLRCD